MRQRIKSKKKLYVSTDMLNANTITVGDFNEKSGIAFSSIQAEMELEKLFARKD